MYGLVNKAIEDLVSTKFGEDTWTAIAEKAGIDVVEFVSMDPYPDEITYRLVAAAAEELGMPQSDLLQAFGEFWTLYTAREGYGELLDMSGQSFEEFLQNLDNLHTRVGLSFPGLMPPSFRCEKVGEDRFLLHYLSSREGLAPMVIGLVRGLARMFEIEISIQHEKQRNNGSDHDVFAISVLHS